MVATPNGYIARANGKSVSTPYDWKDFAESVGRYNNFVVGRTTFEMVGEHGFDGSECEYKLVVSSQPGIKIGSGFTIVDSPQAAIDFLKDKVDALFLVGGSKLNTAFVQARLVDEIRLIVQPFMIGKGISLFAPDEFELPLTYKSAEELEGGRLRITYRIQR